MASTIRTTFDALLGETDAFASAGRGGRNHDAKLPDSQTHDEGTLVISPGGSVSGVVDFAEDTDTISMSLTAGTYLISLTGTGASPLADPYLTSSGLGLVDDDGGIGTNSLITFTVATAGTYTFQVGAYPGYGITGDYTVHLERRGADNVPGTISSTVAANVDGMTFGFIETSGDVDVYRVSLTAGTFYNFEVAGGADYSSDYPPPTGELDTILTVYDAGGNVVFTNDDLDFDNGDIGSGGGFLAETGGFYYVEVKAFTGDTGGYELEIDSVDLSTADPLDAIDWGGVDNVAEDGPLNDGVFYVYFAAAGETFDGTTSLGWTAYERQQVMAAWNTYSTFADVSFAVTNNQSQATFTLVTLETDEFLGSFNPPGTVNAGVGQFAIDGFGWDRTGASGGLEQGGYAWATLIHEFGHGLGMAHPHDDGGGSAIMPGVTDAFNSYGVYDLNQAVYTVMSYNDGWPLHPDAPAGGSPEAWGNVAAGMAFDVALMQEKYGAVACAPGNTTYMLAGTNAPGTFYQCIWDTGGTDAIRYNGTADTVIDLTAATLDYSATGGGVISWVDGVLGGYTIAHGVIIENATGGSGADALTGNSANNRLTGNAGNDTLVGRNGDDQLVGGDGTDNLNGGNGNDALNGSAGGDTMRGGTGDDLYYVDAAGDLVIEAASAGADVVRAGIDYVLTVNVEELFVGGAGRDGTGNALANIIHGATASNVLSGLGGNDTIRGDAGRDTIDGGAGADLIDGGAGKDTLTGGADRDVFQFRDGDFGTTRALADLITDFSHAAAEKIQLNLVDADTIAAGNQAFTWIGNGAFTGVAGQLHYAQAGGNTYVEGDTNGDGLVDFVIALTGTVNLVASDFVL
jgi:hypothetical protein